MVSIYSFFLNIWRKLKPDIPLCFIDVFILVTGMCSMSDSGEKGLKLPCCFLVQFSTFHNSPACIEIKLRV